MADNKYSVNAKLLDLASRLTALEAENKALRTHLWGALETKANDLRHVIQDSIRVPVDGKDGKDGANGVSITGPQGVKGACLVPNDSEIAAALLGYRKKHAAILAKILELQEQNGRRPHSGMKATLAAILKIIEITAQ